VVTELAARLVLLTYNLWSLFTRLMGLNPGHHTEAIKSRRNFLFMAAQSGRKRTAAHNQTGGKSRLVGGVKRLLRKAADMVGGNCARSWNPKATFCACSPVRPPMIPRMARSTFTNPDRLNLNCGF